MQGVAANPETDRRHSRVVVDRNIESLSGETWKDIKEWKTRILQDGYQVSNLGRVRNLGRTLIQKGPRGGLVSHTYPACMLKLSHDSDGYLFVGLRDLNRKTVDARVHQLVAVYFLEQQPKEDQTHVNHKDGNKENNKPENLEWASPYENNLHARLAGLARLGTSQAICGKIIEWNKVFSSKIQTNKAIGRNSGYIEYRQQKGLPIVDKYTGNEVHVEWCTKGGQS